MPTRIDAIETESDNVAAASASQSPTGTASTPAAKAQRVGVPLGAIALVLRIGFVLAFIGGLQVAVERGWINPLFVARPTDVARVLWEGIVSGEFVKLMGSTLFETAVAFLAASLVGISVGYALWRLRDVGRAFDPLLMGLFASPIVLLYPVFVIVFGRTPVAVIVLAATGGVIPIVIGTKQAFTEANATYLKAGRLLCRNRAQWARYVLLPAAVPGLVSGLILGFTYTLLNVLAVEFLANIGGLGARISDASARLRADEMYAALTLVIMMTAAFVAALKRIERSIARKVPR